MGEHSRDWDAHYTAQIQLSCLLCTDNGSPPTTHTEQSVRSEEKKRRKKTRGARFYVGIYEGAPEDHPSQIQKPSDPVLI
jgi:hypothetical protein